MMVNVTNTVHCLMSLPLLPPGEINEVGQLYVMFIGQLHGTSAD